jgi:nicotinamidase-related amidase
MRSHVAALMTNDRYTQPNLASAALITIDVQRDVLDGGAMEVAGTSQALPAIGGLAHAFRGTGKPIVHAIRLYRADGSNVDACRRRSVQDGATTFICDSRGAQLAAELVPPRDARLDSERLLDGQLQELGDHEHAMYKPRWGAFYQTPLEQHLRTHGIDTLVFCGCNFPNCPRTSIYEASERDFRIILVRDGTSGLYARGERELLGIGVSVLPAGELASAVRSVV